MDREVTLRFPVGGVDQSDAFYTQKPREVLPGVYGRTCADATNVMGYEATTDRRRGGTRPGLVRFLATPLVAGWIVQHIDVIVSGGFTTAVQLSQSGRVVTLVGVSQGDLYYVIAGGTTWTAATNNTGDTPALNFTGPMASAASAQKLWIVDGTNACYFNPRDNSINRWTVSAGAFPVDDLNNFPRLACNWRGRIVLSGLLRDPQTIFCSKVGDPTNFDYFTVPFTQTSAVALNTGSQGLTGDVVNCLIPYTDDVLLIGCDSHVYMLQGDPADGGKLGLVTDAVGMCWGSPWARDPYGTVYFVSNKMGIYAYQPGSVPQRISQSIESFAQAIDTGLNGIRLLWEDRLQSLVVFITPLDQPTATTHLLWEQRTGSWWKLVFKNKNHSPITCCTFDGNEPDDRVGLIGSWDGYVRFFSADADDDDGTAIESEVLIGPLLTEQMDEVLFKDMQAILGADSGDVSYAVLRGATAEIALSSAAVRSGTWSAGRNLNTPVRSAAHALYVKVSSAVRWASEQVRVRLTTQGKVRRRGK